VVLTQKGAEVGRATTDVFGEFKIDKLAPNSGSYRLEVTSDSSGRAALNFDLGDESLDLGTIGLSA
jgi:hypothetical protein